MKIEFDIKESLVREVNEILKTNNLDLEIAVQVLCKRIVNENSADFLFYNEQLSRINCEHRILVDTDSLISKKTKMVKAKAIALFRAEGINFNSITTFASKNAVNDVYWANPKFQVLDNDWDLILNDGQNKILYLFKIPAKTYSHNDMVYRHDLPNRIDLQIRYDDITFTDIRSGFSFAKFLKKEISY